MDKSQRMCPECWQPYTIGRPHSCKPKTVIEPPSPTAAVKNVELVKNGVKNALPVSNTSTARTRKWRDAHREKNRRYMRQYMRKKRAAAKVGAAS
jgi:hypothetical protein